MTYVILQGDCLQHLRTIPSGIVQTCVTSPPYFGLRDYGTASWEGGSLECDHRAPDEAGKTTKPTAGQREHAGRFAALHCYRCGAKRIDAQIGLEQTPQDYVNKMVEVFGEVRRVLRPDGTLWLNLGDSYAQQGGPGWQGKNGQRADRRFTLVRDTVSMRGASRAVAAGLKPKDLIGIPWRVALALQQDDWYLRQDIIWHKPNPMPESVRDRCTKAHEYVFLLSKSERYYFDADAIKESATQRDPGNKQHKYTTQYEQDAGEQHRTKAGLVSVGPKEFRNKRSVWTVAPKPFREAHFATFPPELIEPCILAGAPQGRLVLDPFGGAGTTAMVSERLDRHSISIELNPEYVEMARRRVENDRPVRQAAE